MKNIFKNNLFYPQNFFIMTNAYTDIDSIIKEISEKASAIAPECFDAETKYFIYKLQYQPPYVKIPEFLEIKNLQIEAISKTRFKDEYNGYIGIDISEWIGHSEEEHFMNCILSLRKMSPHWKYVFFADESLNNEDIKKTVDFIKSEIWTKELEIDFFSNSKITDRLSEEMKEKHNIKKAFFENKILKATNSRECYVFTGEDRLNIILYKPEEMFDLKTIIEAMPQGIKLGDVYERFDTLAKTKLKKVVNSPEIQLLNCKKIN